MEFEFDPDKSKANKQKHGIDFIEAQVLWQDPDGLEIPAKTEEETRFVVIGKLNNKLWSAAITYRGERKRIISVRRARENEVRLYESQGL